MKNRLRYTAVTIAILGIAFWYSWDYHSLLFRHDNILSVSFLDVGQGDSIYIRAPNGNDAIIDGGPDDTVIKRLHQVMPASDHDIDLMIETHPDKDHIAGLVSVLEEYRVRNFLHSEISSGTSFDQSLKQRAAEESGLNQITARRGERIVLDSEYGIYLDILFPDQNTSDFKDTNDASVVARLVYGTKSFLLTGDSPISVEHFLVQNGPNDLPSTVLKLGHHGSKTSSGDEYLDTVKPSYAIVSAGKNNRYHHPNPETVARVTSRNIPILSTIEKGTITFETDGNAIWTK